MLRSGAVLPGHGIIHALANIVHAEGTKASSISSRSRSVNALDGCAVVHRHVANFRTTGQRAVQQLDAVEVGRIGDAVNFIPQLGDFLLELGAVGLALVGTVGGLLCQLVHTVEHIVDFGQGTLSGLHQGDTVLGVVLSLVQASDLGAHLLGNRQTSGVVTGAVDLVAGGQLLQVGAQGRGVVGVVAVGVHGHYVMLNPHFVCFLSLK